MEKRYIFILAAIILVIGIASVFATTSGDKFWKHHKDGNYNYDKSAWLEKIGLHLDSTDEEIIAAKKQIWADKKTHWTGDKEDYMVGFREKLGLSEDATDEEVKQAMLELNGEDGFHSKKDYTGFGCGKF